MMDAKVELMKRASFTNKMLTRLESKGLEQMSDAQLRTLLGSLTRLSDSVVAVISARKK